MKRGVIGVAAILILIFLSIPNFTLSGNSIPNENLLYSSIIIHNDTEFMEMAEKMKWQGNGSANAPYIIENYGITPTAGMDGISIQNVTFIS